MLNPQKRINVFSKHLCYAFCLCREERELARLGKVIALAEKGGEGFRRRSCLIWFVGGTWREPVEKWLGRTVSSRPVWGDGERPTEGVHGTRY